jgi:carboxyl-terminal processing protease
MIKKSKILILVTALFVGLSAVSVNNDKLYEIAKNIEIFVNVYKELNTHYVDDLDPSQLMRTGIDAMVNSLDPYTNFISESQVASYRISTEGKYDGIGASSKLIDNKITILEPFEGSPADKAGIRAGDVIVKVNGQLTAGKSVSDLNAIVRGVPGTTLDLTIDREGSGQMTKTLTRGSIDIKNVPYAGIVGENVGYISLTTFTANAAKNIRTEFKKLEKEQELDGIILDLRSNGGGLLREAILICNLFLPQGEEIVSTKSKVKERDQHFKTPSSPIDLDIPIVVMVNKRSASASEIVSGVIQDMDRGVILGQRSFGKGLVQNHKEVGYNNRIKVTTSKYYIPSGRCIQGVEYEDGEPVDIPDDQRSTYYTKNRRPVLDGGGVTPDVKLDAIKYANVVNGLQSNHMIFKYVNQWRSKHDSILPIGEFKFNDFNDFVQFLDKNDFQYETETEKYLAKAIEESKEEYADMSSQITQLKSTIESQKENELQENKAQIVDLIEKEIATRYYYQTGKVRQQLANDGEIEEAIAVLKDKARYNKLLKKG